MGIHIMPSDFKKNQFWIKSNENCNRHNLSKIVNTYKRKVGKMQEEIKLVIA